MKILEARTRTAAIGRPVRNAAIGFEAMTASALALVTDRGTGYAFDSIGRYGKEGLLRERFIPRLLNSPLQGLADEKGLIDPDACVRAVMANEKPGGHGERPGAVGLIEAAAWDLRAKLLGVPLWKALAERYGTRNASPEIAAYATCGHWGDDTSLADEVRRALDAGYACIKIKIAGDLGADLPRIETARRLASRLAVDVNGALSRESAEKWLDALALFGLEWIEEPAPPLDFELLRKYSELSRTPLATGENLFSLDDARNLLRYGGLRPERDFVQVDPLLSYGVGEYVRILELFAAWDRRQFLPHAGHLFAAHCVAGLGLGMAEAAPDASLAYGGYWDGVRPAGGRLTIPDAPGVGFERKRQLFALLEDV
jgi:L-alanine-DL-glutamate epimerase-like enolase superfamily enzyme